MVDIVLVDDVLQVISSRIVEPNDVSGGGHGDDDLVGGREGGLPSLCSILLSDELSSIESHCSNNASVMSVGDFPISFSAVLQKLLLNSRGNMIVVVGVDDSPIGVITVRDVWDYVMSI